MELKKIDNDQAIQTWNKLALKHNDTLTIAHNPYLFSFFSDFLKLSPFYLILYSENKPAGLLPLINTRKTFISIPHFSYGGVYWLAGKTDFASAEGQVIQNLVDLILKEKLKTGFYKAELSSANQLIAQYPIEVRSFYPMFNNTDSNKLVHLMYLKETEQEQVKMFSSNLRRKISKASRNKLEIKSGKQELLNDFAKVYNQNMHRIGSPTLGKNFFKALLDIPETNAKLFVVYLNDKPIGGSFWL